MRLEIEIEAAEIWLNELRLELRQPPKERRSPKIILKEIADHEISIKHGKAWLKFMTEKFNRPEPEPPLTFPQNVDNL